MKSGRSEALLALALFWILALMVVPLPPAAVDLLVSLSITIGLLILMMAVYVERPLDFSVFPSLLLIVTLLRLGLNVASTRLILLRGDQGTAAAGHVIEAFGGFTVGGNALVGIVVFVIFVVINFVVITKGAGRIAEVTARFTLDAMPGKQMAIDADLNQGVIDDAEARRRRETVQREADFYGAMDGASKFVRGDAIAGVVILLVNVVGGFAIGTLQKGMALTDAARTYTVLTVGDGLVSQVPALVISTAAGIVVTRAAAGAPLAEELRDQLLARPRALGVAAAMIGALALVPGLPFLPFAALAAGTGLLARSVSARAERERAEAAATPPPAPEVDPETEVRQALALDDLELEIGVGLIPLVDPERGGELLGRIRATRRQLAQELGFVVPLVHIRDNLELEPGGYRILVRGNPVAQATVPPGHWLAIAPGEDAPKIPGIPTRDPAFGLPAVWIQERDRERAAAAGYAVVDASTAIATHLAEVIRSHAAELLTLQQVRELVDALAQRAPRVVEEIIPSVVPLPLLHRTLRALLAERVSIRDLQTIVETLAEHVPKVQDPDVLTDLVRERLSRTITRPYVAPDGTLQVVTLAPDLEERLRASVQRSESGAYLAVDPGTLERLVSSVRGVLSQVGAQGRGPVLLASQTIRAPLRALLSRLDPRLVVIGHNELPPDVRVVGAGTLGVADAHQAV